MAQRVTCQSAVVGPDCAHARFLVLNCTRPENAEAVRAVGAACARLPSLAAAVAQSARPAGAKARAPNLYSAVGFGEGFWRRLAGAQAPRELRAFETIHGAGGSEHIAPATGGDVFLHVKSDRADLCFELARRFLGQANGSGSGVLRVAEEVAGMRYLDSRDLTGFIDGTANPKPPQRAGVALIGAEDRAFAGGSYVLAQRYVHDLVRWARLTVPEQEAAIGRSKRDSRELAAAPPTAHIRRAELHQDGRELPIVRQSLPYGSAGGEQGLYFVAYAKDLSRLQRMLERLLGAASHDNPAGGAADRLMDFTRPVTSAYFFAPSLRTLRSLA